MKSELYLFVIWENGRRKEKFLLNEFKKKFVIREIFEIKWSERNFLNNMQRFYGPKLADVERKTKSCGTGSFLLILITDPNPKFGKRRTSKGMELVNINLFDNKKRYREITGTGFAIHSSITRTETNDDLTLLLGKNYHDVVNELPEKWDGIMKKLELDLVGHSGWNNFNHLLYVLNSTTNYIILRNFEQLPEKFEKYNHNDIDILTDDFLRIPYIVNGGKSAFNKIFSKNVKIGDRSIVFDYSHPNDGIYDKKWAQDLLNRRVLQNGAYVPIKKDHFYSLFYHVIFQQQKISDEYKNKLFNIAMELNISEITKETFTNMKECKNIIEKYMHKMKYRHTNSNQYRIVNNKLFRFSKTALIIWRTQGKNFLWEVIKGKIKRTIGNK